MSDTALCFILLNEIVSTVMPGMRKIRHVAANLAVTTAAGCRTRCASNFANIAGTAFPLTGPTDGMRARMPPADKEEA